MSYTSPMHPSPPTPLLKKRAKKFLNAPRSIGLENKWVLGNLCHLNGLCGLPIVPGQILASLYLIGISPSGIFIEFLLCWHIWTVLEPIFERELQSLEGDEMLSSLDKVPVTKGSEQTNKGVRCQWGGASWASLCLSQVFSSCLHATEWVFIYILVFEQNFWLQIFCGHEDKCIYAYVITDTYNIILS